MRRTTSPALQQGESVRDATGHETSRIRAFLLESRTWMFSRWKAGTGALHAGTFLVLFCVFFIYFTNFFVLAPPVKNPGLGPGEVADQVDNLLVNIHNRHRILFPFLARALGLTSATAWLLLGGMLAVAGPALWFYLTLLRRSPMIVASVLVLFALFKGGALPGYNFKPNGDLLALFLLGLTCLMIIERCPPVAVALTYLLALIAHERVTLLLPAVVVLAYGEYRHEGRRRALTAMTLLVVATVVFYGLKTEFYWLYPLPEQQPVDFAFYVRRFLGLHGSDRSAMGFSYLLDWRGHVTAWGWWWLALPAYVASTWMRRDWMRLAFVSLFIIGMAGQFLIAEDVHRLSNVFYVVLVLLAVDSADERVSVNRRVNELFVVLAILTFIPSIMHRIGAWNHCAERLRGLGLECL